MEIEILKSGDSKSLGTYKVSPQDTIENVKSKVKTTLSKDRQSYRLEPRGKALKESETLSALGLKNGGKLYLKDLGPQIGWKTVFLAEYAGPLLVYLWFYQRPYIFYGSVEKPFSLTVHIAAACYTFHYMKRLLETIFVHRFSHSTMPIRNLFKNCAYYWGFTAYVAYHVNHPLYTTPCMCQVYACLAAFLICELGNFSIHINLRNLRPPGSKVRKIPRPDGNPLTVLFNYVSCPNYTYEIGAWVCFSLMTQCLPAVFFAVAGAYQMTVWALGKHRNYKKEFSDYPKGRKAIFPFVL